MMKAGLTRIFVGILALTPLSLLGCSSDSSPAHSGSGGSTGPAVTTAGGASAGGTTTSPAGSGGAIISSGTPPSGGQSQASSVPQGGSATGGAVSSAAGQPASGSNGGSGSGGLASGGASGGSSATGGSLVGGSVTGGSVAGGSVAGGSSGAGSVASSGGAGGSRAGGGGAGGTVLGGSRTGGGGAGGSVAGGSVAGGRVTGGTATGGVSAGGTGTAGKTAGSSGTPSGGAVVTPATGTYPVSSGKPTIYLASDSTVSYYAPNPNNQEGLGQELQNFFTSDVVVVDDAIGGRSSKSFIDEGHLDAILAVIKPGDYLFAEWGINDRYTSDTTRYTNPATTYRTYLQQYIDGARGKNAIPVIITPTPRLDYQNGVFNNDYVAYCQADAAVAASTNTPLIDLQTMALAYYTQIGITAVQTTIVLVENGQPNVLHFQAHGAYEMARLVALGVQALNLPLSQFVIQAKLDGG